MAIKLWYTTSNLTLYAIIVQGDTFMLETLNRVAVIITPRQSFFDMIAGLSGDPPEKEAAPFTEDESTVYLLDADQADLPTMKERLAHCFREIFFEELEGWYTDTSKWPAAVTWQEFESYFHISFQSVVLDAGEMDIEYE